MGRRLPAGSNLYPFLMVLSTGLILLNRADDVKKTPEE